MRRYVYPGGVLAALLLVGCSSSPDLMQCQAVADLDSQLESVFEQKNAGDVPDEELSSRLDELADAYADVDVDGDLGTATSVWECSHVGGDRFAANIVILPEGLHYSRLTPSTAALPIDAYLEGSIHLPNYMDIR